MKMMTTMTTTKKKRMEITNPVWRLRFRVAAACLAVLLLTCAVSSSSASPSDKHRNNSYALIYATVWGKGAETIYGVRVQLRRAGDKKVIGEQISNHTGEVAFRVPAGKQDYTLTADVKLSKDKAKPQATAHVENDERVEVSLHLTE
jgi:hypothetical protein